MDYLAKKHKVIEAFDEEGTAVLLNLFEKFNKEIRFEGLHILRAIYLNSRN